MVSSTDVLVLPLLLLAVVAAQTLYPRDGTAVTELTGEEFGGTVYRSTGNKAHLMQFYMHTCGHCRAFAPSYERLAREMRPYDHLLTVAAINCALDKNRRVCQDNVVPYTPYLKYFAANAREAGDGKVLRADKKEMQLRRDLLGHLAADGERNGYGGRWPDFAFLPDASTVNSTWQLAPPSAPRMAIVFDQHSSPTSAQMLMQLSGKLHDDVYIRRALASNSLLLPLALPDQLPIVVIFERHSKQPLYLTSLADVLSSAVENRLDDGGRSHISWSQGSATPSPPPPPRRTPNSPSPYSVSERDILLATRRALFDEVITFKRRIDGPKFDAMRAFVKVLQKYYPSSPDVVANGGALSALSIGHNLTLSGRARGVIDDMARLLGDSSTRNITIGEWRSTFEASEASFGLPFTHDGGYDQCKGSSAKYRGYSCGLWTLFHTLTVNSFIVENYAPSATRQSKGRFPRRVLEGIGGWVENYFSCRTCAEHFSNMTSIGLPMGQWVNHPSDVVMYLWRAHNMVNGRLAGDVTDDPALPKTQFPPVSLCPKCHKSDGSWHLHETLNFLIRYYTDITPVMP